MTWFKVDDQLAFHPKIIACTPTAIALWVRAGAWSAGHLTDGCLPAAMISPLGYRKRDAEKLVEVGLWEAHKDGYRFRNWEEYQPTKAQVEEEREQNKARQQAWRDRRRNVVRNAVTDTVTDVVTNSAPTRPDPTTTKEETSSLLMPPAERSASEPRAHRLPDDWAPGDAGCTYARERGIDGSRLDNLVDNFRDHWLNKPGKDGRKIDWNRAWQQWVRNEVEWTAKRGNGNGGGTYPTAVDNRPPPLRGDQIIKAREEYEAAEHRRYEELMARKAARA